MEKEKLKMKTININEIEKNMNPFNKAQLYRLQKWKEEKKYENTSNRNLDYALNMIQIQSKKLKLNPTTQENINHIYEQSVKKGLLSGRSIEGLIGGSIYTGIRLERIIRTATEVGEICKITEKEILRNTRLICKELKIKLPILSPNEFIPYFCEKLHLSKKVEEQSYNLLEDCEIVGLINGRSPSSMAGVCLYIASLQCNERRTQMDIADVCGVTDVTIRNRLKELKKVLELEI